MPRLLFVAYYFAPETAVATRRAARIARTLADRGWQVDVLARELRLAEAVDPALWSDRPGVTVHRAPVLSAKQHARRWRQQRLQQVAAVTGAAPATSGSVAAPATAHAAAPMRGLARTVLDFGHRNLAIPDPEIGFFAPAVALGARLPKPDVVLATLPPPTAALVAHALARRFGVGLVLDYRDPWLGTQEFGALPAWRQRLETAMERTIVDHGARAVATTRGIAATLQQRYGVEVAYVPNACEPERFANVVPRVFAGPTLVYTGNLYGGRGLEQVFASMARLRAAGAPTPRLCYLGATSREAQAQAEAAGVLDLVDLEGMRPSAEALAAMRGATANVNVVGAHHARQIPAKAFEQIAARRPILLQTPLPSDTASLLADVPDVQIVEGGDAAAMDAAIAALTTTPVRDAGDAIPALLTVEATMDALEAVLLAAAAGARRGGRGGGQPAG